MLWVENIRKLLLYNFYHPITVVPDGVRYLTKANIHVHEQNTSLLGDTRASTSPVLLSVTTGDLNVNQSCAAVDACAVNPCMPTNTFECTSTPSGAVCTCNVGFSGAFCQHNIDECASDPCQNGGRCIDIINEYMCNCTLGYSGESY